MIRDLRSLASIPYDVLIIGGGIYGACAAWEAASRGLVVALLEKGDFASATSANSLKIIHGGFRYLQHAGFKRMRQSVNERNILMRIAPHLVHPLPVLVPTYGHGIKGREAFWFALKANDLLGFGRNGLDDPQKHIPRSRLLSRRECLNELPGINTQQLTGGAVFYDAQVYNSERLVLAFLRSAAESGAALANYAAVTGLLVRGNRVEGVQAEDTLRGDRFEVRARWVLNASGPWVGEVLTMLGRDRPASDLPLARAINLITRPLFERYAVGLPGDNGYRNGKVVARKGESFLFVTPWRGRSIVGTFYQRHPASCGEFRVTEADVQALLSAVNRAYPAGNLLPEDVSFVHAGLLPARSGNAAGVKLANQSSILDHRKEGIQGILSVVGVKYTTARQVAQEAVNQAFKGLGIRPSPSITDATPLYGGRIECFEPFLQSEVQRQLCGLGVEKIRLLIYNYGSAYPEVLRYIETSNLSEDDQPDSLLLRAQTLYAVHEEMAQKLGDVVFRRTELGTAGYPGRDKIECCARVMAKELCWSQARLDQEIAEVESHFIL